MAIQITAAQLAEYQKNLAANSGKKLYANRTARTAPKRPLPRRERLRDSAVRTGKRVRSATIRGTKRHAPRIARNVGRAAYRPVRKVGGGAATLLTLIIGTGVLIAIIRNPSVITAPLSFIGSITTAAVNLTKH